MEENENLAEVSNETEVKQETKLFKKPNSNSMYQKHRDDESDPETEAFAKGEFNKPSSKSMYQKHRDDESDPETEAFAKGELNKFNQDKAEAATVQKDTETSEEIASSDTDATPSTERPENAEDRVFLNRHNVS